MTLIDELNQRLTIKEILKLLPDLKQVGEDWVGMCPTGHDSKSKTSFRVSNVKNYFHCFNCGASGSYIHLVELVNFGVSSSGKGGTDTFKKTLKLLADQYGLSDQSYSDRDSIYEIITSVAANYKYQLEKYAPSLHKSIEDKYGLTKRFQESEMIGYGHNCPSSELLEYFSYEELLSTGLFNKTDKTKTKLFHIFQNRITFPYNINGQVKYMIGRKTKSSKNWPDGTPAPKYFKQYIHKPGREHIHRSIKNQIVHCTKDTNEVIITEGITDYLAAKMNGYSCVSAVTTSFKSDEYKQVVNFCKKFKKVYIANDNDKNEAGQKGSKRICEMLIDSGINPNIVLLPRPTDTDKIDLAEFLRDSGVEEFERIKSESETYLHSLINSIPSDIDKTELSTEIEPVLQALSALPIEQAEIYLQGPIKRRFKLNSMRLVLSGFMKRIKDIKDKTLSEKPSSIEIFKDNSTDIKMISSGQDYKDGVLYYTITRPHQVTDKNGVMRIVNKPFLVDSQRNIMEIKDAQIISDGFALNRKISPEIKLENWSFKDTPYSIEKYVSGDLDINPAELYIELRDLFVKHVYFKHRYEESFLAVAIMTFPLYMIFDAIGYIHLWAEKRSGKTTVMELLYALGFNAMMSSSMTDAAIFRSIEIYRCLLLIDEAEDLNPTKKARENGQSEKLELLKSGYKRSGSATRCEGQSNTVVTFHNYGPKVFAGTKKADDVLGDRMILIAMKRAMEGVNIEELIEKKSRPITDRLRNKTMCYAMQFASQIENIYLNEFDDKKDKLSKNKVVFRTKELWTPYLCTAILIDKFDSNLNVFDLLLTKACAEEEDREAFAGDSKSMEILEQLYLWTKRVESGKVPDMKFLHEGEIYSRKGITDNFIKQVLKSEENDDDYSYMTYQRLKQLLRKYDVIDKDSDIKGYRFLGKRSAAILLNRNRMLESLITFKRYYDEDVLQDVQAYKGVSNEIEEVVD